MTGIRLGGWRDAARPPMGRSGLRRRIARAVSRLGLLTSTPPRPHEPITLCLTAVVMFSALFLAFPGLDLAASELFYRAGTGFALGPEPSVESLSKER